MRDAIIAALDHWWLIERDANASVATWIADVLARADDASWRTRLRKAVVQKNLPHLLALAREDHVLAQPPTALKTLAQALLEFEGDDAAIGLLRRAQRRYPDDFWMNFDLGWALLRQRPASNAEALRCFSVARLLRPDLAGVYLNIGSLLAEGQDWEGAVFYARQAIERDADLASAHNLLGVGLSKIGSANEAVDAYQKALSLNADLAEAHYNLGLLRQRQGGLDDALSALERATQLDPNDAEYWYMLGNVRYEKREYTKALAAYQRAVRLDADFAMARNNLGNSFKALGRLNEAIEEYKHAIQLGPQSELDKVFSNLGAAWHLMGRADLATSAYRAAVNLKPDSAPNQYNLGSGLQALEDWGGAASTYREVIRLDPDFAEAHCNLGHVLRRMGQLDEALDALERGHELGSRRDDWPYPSRKWIEQVRRLMRAAQVQM